MHFLMLEKVEKIIVQFFYEYHAHSTNCTVKTARGGFATATSKCTANFEALLSCSIAAKEFDDKVRAVVDCHFEGRISSAVLQEG